MNSRSISMLAAAMAVVMALAPGCNKDDDDETLYLDGTITLVYPEYVRAGFTKQFCVDTLSTLNRDGDYTGIGYYFSNWESTKDTLIKSDGTVISKVFSITAPDSLDTFSSYLSGYASGYYSSSSTVSFTVVNEKSITGIEHPDGQPTFTDPRDGNVYNIATCDDVQWLEPNLCWTGAGASYANCSAMSGIFGNYYTWEEACTACPEGWRLPTDEEWVKMAVKYGADKNSSTYSDIKGGAGELMADGYFNGEKLWEYWPAVSLGNSSLLAVLPFGYSTVIEGVHNFTGLEEYALFWTSDQKDDLAVYRYFYVDQNIVFCGLGSKNSLGASVRCVR